MELKRGSGDTWRKIKEIPGVGGSTMTPSNRKSCKVEDTIGPPPLPVEYGYRVFRNLLLYKV